MWCAVRRPESGIDWDTLGFGLQHACKTQFLATCNAGGEWGEGELAPYGPLHLMPSAQALNYGQSVFEGMKARQPPLPPPVAQ